MKINLHYYKNMSKFMDKLKSLFVNVKDNVYKDEKVIEKKVKNAKEKVVS